MSMPKPKNCEYFNACRHAGDGTCPCCVFREWKGIPGQQPLSGDPFEKELSEYQIRMLSAMEHGCGWDAKPGQFTCKERLEMQQLVEKGLVVLSKNHSGDTHGMYILADYPVHPGSED